MSKSISSIFKELRLLTGVCWVSSVRKTSINRRSRRITVVGSGWGAVEMVAGNKRPSHGFMMKVHFHFRKVSKNSNRRRVGVEDWDVRETWK